MANGITKAARSSQKDKQQAEQNANAAQEKQTAAENQQKQLDQQLAHQRQQLQTLQNQISDADKQIKQRKLQRIKAAQQEIDQNDLLDNNDQPITVTEANVTQMEQELDSWRQEERDNWETDKQDYQDELDNLNQEIITARTTKTELSTTNQQLTTQNQQLQNENTTVQNQINDYKNQLVDTIAENAPEHKVDSSLLKPNEKAQAVITNTGRQQHLRQPLKYLMDTVTEVLQKVKTEATKFIDHVVKILIAPNGNQSPKNLQSRELDPSSITASDKPIDHLKEKQLQNDPAVKLKKAILSANSEQLQKVDQQVKQSLKQQVEDDIEY